MPFLSDLLYQCCLNKKIGQVNNKNNRKETKLTWGMRKIAFSGRLFCKLGGKTDKTPDFKKLVSINRMAFFTSAISILQTLVIAIGAGLGVWGVINLMEGYGNDNPGAKSQGMKQLMAGGGVILIGTQLIPVLSTLF